jgi:hypothetical protein
MARTVLTATTKSFSIPPVNTSAKVKEREEKVVVRMEEAQEMKLAGTHQSVSADPVLW